MTDIYIILCQYLLYWYIDLINLYYKHHKYVIEISASAAFPFLGELSL